MRVMIERVAGLDVHQETVVVCVLIGKPGERPTKEVRTFRTMTRDLEALREWLLSLGVTHVGDPCRDGEHRRLLEARLCRA
jgi:transposase